MTLVAPRFQQETLTGGKMATACAGGSASCSSKGAGSDAKDARGEFRIPVKPEWQRRGPAISRPQIAAPDQSPPNRPASSRAEPALGRSGAAHAWIRKRAVTAAYPERAAIKRCRSHRLEVTATSTQQSGTGGAGSAVRSGVCSNISDYQPLGTRSGSFWPQALRPRFVRQLRPGDPAAGWQDWPASATGVIGRR